MFEHVAHAVEDRSLDRVLPGDFARDPAHGISVIAALPHGHVAWAASPVWLPTSRYPEPGFGACGRARHSLARSHDGMSGQLIRRRRRTRYEVCFYVPRISPLLVRDPVNPAGGAETQILLLASALAARGLRVCLIAFAMPGVQMPETVADVDVRTRPAYRARLRLGKLREVTSILTAVARTRAHVIVARMEAPEVGVAALAAKALGRGFVYSSASLSDFEPDPQPARDAALESGAAATPDFSRLARKSRDWRLFRLGLRLADKIVVQTEEQVRLCEQNLGRTPILIGSIAELALPRDHVPEAFLWVGRVVPMKRAEVFLALARAVPEARFWMVAVPAGDRSEDLDLFSRLEREAAGISNVELLAPRPREEVLELMNQAVAIVSTSDFEGMPNTFLESWARGVPALAFAHDPDGVIQRYELGAIANGSPAVLADHARRLWQRRSDLGDLPARCRSYVREHHSPEVVSARWEEVLRTD
jgi:glycosyltransferase involved in cell wall biosynthesis